MSQEYSDLLEHIKVARMESVANTFASFSARVSFLQITIRNYLS